MNTEKRLYQWDTGQKLVGCTGLYVDFPIGTEVYRVETTDGMCIIPDELLQTSGGHKVYECMTNNTIRSFAFSVTPRPKPPDYVYTPTERLTFEGLVQKVDDAVADMIRRAESGEFDGYTPVKGKDYFTASEIQQIQNEVSSGAIGEFKSVVDTETETFNNNAETKLTAYNQNDSQKTTAYNTNAESKLNAYNANANNKLAEFDSHTEQVQMDISELKSDMIRRADSGEFDGHTPIKGTDYFTASEIQQIQNEVSSGAIGEFKSVVDTETETFNNNAETKLTAYNQNDSQKTTAYNTNAESKLNAYNANANNKLAEFDSHTEQVQMDISELKSDLIDVRDICCDQEEITNINLLKPSEFLYSKRLSTGTADIVDSITVNVVTGKIPVKSGNWYSLSRELDGLRTTYGEKTSNSLISRILLHLKDGSTAGAYQESSMSNEYVKLISDETGYAFKVLSNDVESMQIQIYFNIDISTSDKFKENKVMLVIAETFTEAVSKAINSEYVDGDLSIFKYSLKKDETKVDKDTFKDRVKEIISEQASAKNLFSFENGDANISLLSKNKPDTDYVYETSSSYGYKDVEKGYYVCNGGILNFGIKNAMPLKPETGSYLLSAEIRIPSGNTDRTVVKFGVCCYPVNSEGKFDFKEYYDLKYQDEWVKIEKVISIKDEHDAVYVSFASYIDTYPLYIRDINFIPLEKKWVGKKWVALGDSITERNSKTLKNYHDYIAENTGIEVVNMGVSGTGYKSYEDTTQAFYQRILNVPTDADVITIFGSGNDCGGNYTIGEVTDTGTDTLCGCINTTIDNLFSIAPTAKLGIITPTPWRNFNPADDTNIMAQYSSKIVEICRRRGIPCRDLYHCSGMRPWDDSFRALMYPLNSAGDDHEGVHSNELGHAFFAPEIQAFLETLIL